MLKLIYQKGNWDHVKTASSSFKWPMYLQCRFLVWEMYMTKRRDIKHKRISGLKYPPRPSYNDCLGFFLINLICLNCLCLNCLRCLLVLYLSDCIFRKVLIDYPHLFVFHLSRLYTNAIRYGNLMSLRLFVHPKSNSLDFESCI